MCVCVCAHVLVYSSTVEQNLPKRVKLSVQEILSHKMGGSSQLEFNVRWVNAVGNSGEMWVSESQISNRQDLLQVYKQTNNISDREKTTSTASSTLSVQSRKRILFTKEEDEFILNNIESLGPLQTCRDLPGGNNRTNKDVANRFNKVLNKKTL